jgi:hypothetical protein
MKKTFTVFLTAAVVASFAFMSINAAHAAAARKPEPKKKSKHEKGLKDVIRTKYGTKLEGIIISETDDELVLYIKGGKMTFQKRILISIERREDKAKAKLVKGTDPLIYNAKGVQFSVSGGIWIEDKKPPRTAGYLACYSALDGQVTITFKTQEVEENEFLDEYTEEYVKALKDLKSKIETVDVEREVIARLSGRGLTFFTEKSGCKYMDMHYFCIWKKKSYIFSFNCLVSHAKEFTPIFKETISSFIINEVKINPDAASEKPKRRSPYKYTNDVLKVRFQVPRRGWVRIPRKDEDAYLAKYRHKKSNAVLVFSTTTLHAGADLLEEHLKKTQKIEITDKCPWIIKRKLGGETAWAVSGTEDKVKKTVTVYVLRARRIFQFKFEVDESKFASVNRDFEKVLGNFKFLK